MKIPPRPAVASVQNIAPESPSPATESISYSYQKYGSVEKFIKHSDFKVFKTQYRTGMARLISFVKNNIAPEKAVEAVELLNENVSTYLKKLFTEATRDDSQKYVRRQAAYEQGKNALDGLLNLCDDRALPEWRLVDAIMTLAPDLSLCPDGAAKNFSDCVNRLQYQVGGGNWNTFRQKKAEDLINAFVESKEVREKYDLSRGRYIHCVAGLTNVFSTDFGLTTQQDSYADSSGITRELIEDCRRFLEPRMTGSALAHGFSEEYLSKITCAMQSSFTDGNTAAAFSYVPYDEILDHAMKELEPMYGPISKETVVQPLNDAYSELQLRKDPSLIAKQILEKQTNVEDAKHATSTFRTSREKDVSSGSRTACIRTYGDGIFWAIDSAGDPQIVTISHLNDISPEKCHPGLRKFIGQIVRNSQPHEFLAELSLPWLLELDMAMLAQQISEDCFSALLDTHQNAIRQLAVNDQYRLTKAIVADAPAECIKRFAGNIPALFPGKAAQEVLFAELLDIARQRPDADVLDTLLARASSATKTKEIASLTNNVCKTLSNTYGKPPAQLAALLFKYGELIIDSQESGLLAPNVIKKMIKEMAPAFAAAMRQGNAAQISAFGNFLLLAHDKGMLEKKAIARIFKGPLGPEKSPLAGAFREKQSKAVTAFGNAMLSAYQCGILGDSEVRAILACPPRNPDFSNHIRQTQGEALVASDALTKEAFGDILQRFEVMRTGKIPPNRSVLDFFRANPEKKLDYTKYLWLCGSDFGRLVEQKTNEGENCLSLFLDEYRNIFRTLPESKRIALTAAVVRYGKATDLTRLVENDDRLFSGRHYIYAKPPQYLFIAMNNKDCNMIQTVGRLLMNKISASSRLSPHTKQAIIEEWRNIHNVPAKPFKMTATLYLHRIIAILWQKKFLTKEDVLKTYLDQHQIPLSEFSDAILAGSDEQIETIDDILRLAHQSKLLSASQVAQLLSGTQIFSPQKHILKRALQTNNADAIVAFGRLISRWIDRKVFDFRNMQHLLQPSTNPSLQELLGKADEKTVAAYQKILRDHHLAPSHPLPALAAA